jgi:hypothetical protein
MTGDDRGCADFDLGLLTRKELIKKRFRVVRKEGGRGSRGRRRTTGRRQRQASCCKP